jgi:hypothetical protein
MHVVTPIFRGLFRKLKISYTREFLLSFSGLDICKEFPSGFDRSLLRYSIYNSFDFTPKMNARVLHFSFTSSCALARVFVLSICALSLMCYALPFLCGNQ